MPEPEKHDAWQTVEDNAEVSIILMILFGVGTLSTIPLTILHKLGLPVEAAMLIPAMLIGWTFMQWMNVASFQIIRSRALSLFLCALLFFPNLAMATFPGLMLLGELDTIPTPRSDLERFLGYIVLFLGIALHFGLTYLLIRPRKAFRMIRKVLRTAPKVPVDQAADSQIARSASWEHLVGQSGQTRSALRPQGKVVIAGTTYPARTPMGYLRSGAKVVVVAVCPDELVVEDFAGEGVDGEITGRDVE